MKGEFRVKEIRLSKGFQFTLPAAIRQRHHLRPGQKIEVIDLRDEIILRPKGTRKLTSLLGRFRLGRKFSVEKELDKTTSGF